MEAIVQDEEYAYFQPGGMIFVVTSKSDQWLKPPEKIGVGAQVMAQMDDSAKQPATEQNQDPVNDPPDRLPVRSFDEQVNALIGWSDEQAKKLGLTITRRLERELHFPGTQSLPEPPPLEAFPSSDVTYVSPNPVRRGAFSLIPVDVKTISSEGSGQEEKKEGFAAASKIAVLAANLDSTRAEPGQPLLGSELGLTVVTPNWLSSPTSETGGGGGPGSRPEPYMGPSNTKEYKFQLPDKLKDLCSPDEKAWGKGVKVSILDTAPSIHDLVAAYEVYHKVNPARKKQDHLLLESLLAPRDPQDPRPPALTVHPASTEDLMRMRSVHLKDHNYNMTDHGLFVAGIIHSIAPASEIHLYEVLNPEGVGDLESIARGLWTVAYDQYLSFVSGRIQPSVVSCSLMLNLPLEGDPDNPDTATIIPSGSPLPVVGHRLIDLNPNLLDQLKQHPDWVTRGGEIIMWICDVLYWCGSRVVAAAGNDWKPEDAGRPRARYLAAFESVQGVGALKKPQNQTVIDTGQYEIASYSDLSDEPGRVGVATLGGEAGEGKGVLGLYLGEFPLSHGLLFRLLLFLQSLLRWIVPKYNGLLIQPKNLSHWAWWAGTSFATPILSGVIAAVLSRQTTPPRNTEAAIRRLYGAKVIEQARTDYKEDLLNVTQGS